MLLVNRRSFGLIERIWMLWSLLVVVDYKERDIALTKNRFVADYGERHWEQFVACLESLEDYGCLTSENTIELTPKGERIVTDWQAINRKLYSF